MPSVVQDVQELLHLAHVAQIPEFERFQRPGKIVPRVDVRAADQVADGVVEGTPLFLNLRHGEDVAQQQRGRGSSFVVQRERCPQQVSSTEIGFKVLVQRVVPARGEEKPVPRLHSRARNFTQNT